MLVRAILGIVIMISTSLIGFIKAMQYETRVKEIDNVIDSINVLETEVVYYQNTLPRALKRSGERSKGVISRIYKDVAVTIDAKEGETLESIWGMNVNLHLDRDVLGTDDIEIIADFGRELGLGSTKEQSKYFDYMKHLLKQQRKIAYDEMLKNSGLYRKLGVLLGISIFVIII